MYCSKCGEIIDDEAVICPKCGCKTLNFDKDDKKNIIINNSASSSAAAASFGPTKRKKKYNFLIDLLLICCTGGLWIIWMLIRPKYEY